MIIMDDDTHFKVRISRLSIVFNASERHMEKHVMLDHTATHHSLTNTDKRPDRVRFLRTNVFTFIKFIFLI